MFDLSRCDNGMGFFLVSTPLLDECEICVIKFLADFRFIQSGFWQGGFGYNLVIPHPHLYIKKYFILFLFYILIYYNNNIFFNKIKL